MFNWYIDSTFLNPLYVYTHTHYILVNDYLDFQWNNNWLKYWEDLTIDISYNNTNVVPAKEEYRISLAFMYYLCTEVGTMYKAHVYSVHCTQVYTHLHTCTVYIVHTFTHTHTHTNTYTNIYAHSYLHPHQHPHPHLRTLTHTPTPTPKVHLLKVLKLPSHTYSTNYITLLHLNMVPLSYY